VREEDQAVVGDVERAGDLVAFADVVRLILAMERCLAYDSEQGRGKTNSNEMMRCLPEYSVLSDTNDFNSVKFFSCSIESSLPHLKIAFLFVDTTSNNFFKWSDSIDQKILVHKTHV
jgi:hypothetical protein